ncbi:MAG: hypothetical protein JSU61_10865 [Fidelibacterota bacterium]|nr:MAG: hypothetical protein JSU61_10865 [Candidatus Neomarinimicrobiota bacterium]
MTAIRWLPIIMSTALLCSCNQLLVDEAASDQNLADFDETWNIVNSRYPYLEWKQIDWDSIRTVYRPRAEQALGDEFYKVLYDLLYELKDGHVYYQTEGGGQVYPYFPTPRALRDRKAFSPYVVRKYFDKELRVTKEGGFEYEFLPGRNIGYVWISSFESENFNLRFAEVLEYFRDTEGLIIDDRNGSGGSLQSNMYAVGRFLSSPIDTIQVYDADGQRLDWPSYGPVGPFRYTAQVVVIINGGAYSARENFADKMKSLPNVTVIGDTTGGGSAGQNSSGYYAGKHVLPSGKIINIPKFDIRRLDGLPWEDIGVPPDIRVLQTAADIKRGQDKQLEYAIELLP